MNGGVQSLGVEKFERQLRKRIPHTRTANKAGVVAYRKTHHEVFGIFDKRFYKLVSVGKFRSSVKLVFIVSETYALRPRPVCENKFTFGIYKYVVLLQNVEIFVGKHVSETTNIVTVAAFHVQKQVVHN